VRLLRGPPVAQLKKCHIRTWAGQHKGRKSPATERSVLTIVLAAFKYSQANHDVPSPLKGLKKSASRPRRPAGTSCSPPCTPGCGRSARWPG
jgi:hypothetical protein